MMVRNEIVQEGDKLPCPRKNVIKVVECTPSGVSTEFDAIKVWYVETKKRR